MINLCKYSDIFGKVKEGIHSYRIFDIAVLDVLLTVITAYIVHKYFFENYSFIYILLGIFIIGIISHRIFCMRTTIDKMLFR